MPIWRSRGMNDMITYYGAAFLPYWRLRIVTVTDDIAERLADWWGVDRDSDRLYALRAMGAGDVKLMAAVGSMVGWEDWFGVFVITAVVGGVMAVIFSLARKRLGTRTRPSPPYKRDVSSLSSGAFPSTLESRSSKSHLPTFMRHTFARSGPLLVSI